MLKFDPILVRAFYRFLRGAVAGAVASMLTVSAMTPDDWNNMAVWGQKLLFSGMIGFATGGLMAVDKYLRDNIEEEKEQAKLDAIAQEHLGQKRSDT